MDLGTFSAKYPPRPPRRDPANDAERRLLTQEDGVEELGAPPARADVKISPENEEDPAQGRHLWVFFRTAVPYVLETVPRARIALRSGMAKHTNLTGGEAASCGGELWVDPLVDVRLYISGASGRYGPTTSAQLEDAVEVFRHRGFDPVSFGWDEDLDRAARFLRT